MQKFYFLLVFLLIPASVLADSCYPAVDSAKVQSLVGYGSFMNSGSLQRTDMSIGISFPIELTGYERIWSVPSHRPNSNTTYLGVIKKPSQAINAVIFRVTAQGIELFDQRESAYCRKAVPPALIQLLGGTKLKLGESWIYVQKNEVSLPSKEAPIAQSYVDVFLAGCLKLQEKYNLPGFALRCITTTKNWSTNWVNDRVQPRRPYIYQPYAGKIDKLLHATLPNIYHNVPIE